MKTADLLKKNLAAALCALIVSAPITQAVSAPMEEGPVAPGPVAPAALPAVETPIAGPSAPQDVIGHTLPQDPAALLAPVSAETAAAMARVKAEIAGQAPTGEVIHQTPGAWSTVDNSAAGGAADATTSVLASGAVGGAWEKALEIIGKARTKALLKRAGRGDALAREAKEMQANTAKKPEVFIPEFYRGRVPLSYLSAIETELGPAERARIDALKDLIRNGLRPVNDPYAPVYKVTPASKALMQELGIAYSDLQTPVMDADKIDRDNDIPPAVWRRAAKLGLMRLKVPKEYGGLGLHQREYAEVMKSLARISGSLMAALSAQNTIATAPLAEFGTERQKALYLPRVAKGEFVSSFGLTEPGAGTDLNKMGMTAVLSADKKSWRLTGQKIFITGVDDAGMLYLVTGHTIIDGVDVGPTVLMVELPFLVGESWDAKVAKMKALDKKGLRIMSFTRDSGLELMMIHGSDQAFIQMKDFEVPVAREGVPTMLGAPGEGKIVPLVSLNRGRAGFGPMIAASAASFAQRALSWAADRKMFDMYAKKGQEGVQGGMEYVSAKLGRAGMKSAALEAASDLTQALVEANPDKGVAAMSAAIKARAAEDNWEIAQDALELGGGHALFMGAPMGLERDFRDAWIARIVEGVDPAMQQFVHLIGGGGVQKEMMSPLSHPLAVPAFLARQVLARSGIVLDKGDLKYEDAAWIQLRAARYAWRFGMSATGATVLRPIVKLPGVGLLGRALAYLGRLAQSDAKPLAVVTTAIGLIAAVVFVVNGIPAAAAAAYAGLVFAGALALAGLLHYGGAGLVDAGRVLSELRPFEKRQNALIAAENVRMDIFELAAVELKLAKAAKGKIAPLSEEEKAKLDGARDFLKQRIDARMKLISILEDPVERTERRVGEAMLKAEQQRQSWNVRENVVERHMKWLKEKTDAFFGGEFEGNVEEPSGLDGAAELKSAQERAKAMSRFSAPRPVRWVQKLMSPLARWALRSRFEIETIEFPKADRDRLAAAANPNTAAFFGPVHPEFGTDWIIDKVVTDQYAPRTMHWAAADVVKMAPRLLSANNVMANSGGEAAKDLSIQNALAGNGVLLHPEGTVLWTSNHTNTIFPGIADMAMEAARRSGPDGKPVNIVPLVWKSEYVGDVSRALIRDIDAIEAALRLPSHQGLSLADRFAELQENVLARQQQRFRVSDPLPYGINSDHDFFERQELVRQALVDRLKSSHDVAPSPSVEKTVQRLIKVIRADRKRALAAGDAARAEALKNDLAMAEEAKRLGKFTREVYGSRPELTQEEIGESLKRLRADLVKGGLGNAVENMAPKPYGARALHVRVPQPIRVDPKSSETSEQYLARMHAAMQGGLDEINAEIAPDVDRFAVHNAFFKAADLSPLASLIGSRHALFQHVLSATAVGALPVERVEPDDRPAQRRGDEAMRLVRALLADPATVEGNMPVLAKVLGAGAAGRLLASAKDLQAEARASRPLAQELARIRLSAPLSRSGVEAFRARLSAVYPAN